MRQPEQKSGTEPEASRTDEPAAKTAPADPCTAPDPQHPVYKEADQKQRDQILQDMLRGLTATERDSVCKRFRRALAAFSTSQMLTMKSAGVRFWRAGEFRRHSKTTMRRARRSETKWPGITPKFASFSGGLGPASMKFATSWRTPGTMFAAERLRDWTPQRSPTQKGGSSCGHVLI